MFASQFLDVHPLLFKHCVISVILLPVAGAVAGQPVMHAETTGACIAMVTELGEIPAPEQSSFLNYLFTSTPLAPIDI